MLVKPWWCGNIPWAYNVSTAWMAIYTPENWYVSNITYRKYKGDTLIKFYLFIDNIYNFTSIQFRVKPPEYTDMGYMQIRITEKSVVVFFFKGSCTNTDCYVYCYICDPNKSILFLSTYLDTYSMKLFIVYLKKKLQTLLAYTANSNIYLLICSSPWPLSNVWTENCEAFYRVMCIPQWSSHGFWWDSWEAQ